MTLLELILSKKPEKSSARRRRRRGGKPVGSRAKNGGVSGEEIFCPLAYINNKKFKIDEPLFN